jgi:hypothetical protein
MKFYPRSKVYQNYFGDIGNCLSAVFATLFNKTIDEVPNFNDSTDPYFSSDDYWDFVEKYLNNLGYDFRHIEYSEDAFRLRSLKDNYVIVTGKSPRGYSHPIIFKDGIAWHDPNPAGGGIEPEFIMIIYPLHHANMNTHQDPSWMFGQDQVDTNSLGPSKTCKKCYYTGPIKYERVNPTNSNLQPIPVAIYGCCNRCNSKVFLELPNEHAKT